MATRSRKGCIDCKQAKIKCDEVHPFCGTCTRRSRKCRGYPVTLGKNHRGPGEASGSSNTRANTHSGLGSNHDFDHNSHHDSNYSNNRSGSISHGSPLYGLDHMTNTMRMGTGSSSHGHQGHHGRQSIGYARQSFYTPYGRPSGRASSMVTMSSISPMSMKSSTIVVAVLPETIAAAAQIADDRSADIPWAPIEWQDRSSVASMSTNTTDIGAPCTERTYSMLSAAPGVIATPSSGTFLSGGSCTPLLHSIGASQTPDAVACTPLLDSMDLSDFSPLAQPMYFHPGHTTGASSTAEHTAYKAANSSSHDLLFHDNASDAVDAELSTVGATAHESSMVVATAASKADIRPRMTNGMSSHERPDSPPKSSRSLVGPDKRRLIGPAAAAMSTSPVLEVSSLWSPSTPAPVRGPSFMPLNDILAKDKPFIEIYFMRHPAEMIMGNSMFINEMNGFVLSLLQVSPIVVGDSLCAIGENYIKEMAGDGPGSNIVSHRKTRLLNRLRLLNEDGSSPELVLLLLLALCGAELTNPKSDGLGSSLPALIENVAMILEFHTRSGHEISTMAKYFAKGVARQDLLHSLSRMQRPKIQPSTWLDDYSMRHADRLLGLTATLTPILYKLAELAGDVQAILNNDAFYQGTGGQPAAVAAAAAAVAGAHGQNNTSHSSSLHDPNLPSMVMTPSGGGAADFDDAFFGESGAFFSPDAAGDASLYLTQRSDLAEREAAIRAQLLMWRPIHDSSLSIQTSRSLLLHASAWRAAALLYLFRLFNRPGSSPDADQTALSMAYEIMMHINGPAEDVKLSLWPLFIAACELDQPEDRALATALFAEVCHARPTMTAHRTREFVVDHIWPAHDRGDVWDWMQLTQSGHSHVFMPL
ncbi:hypothetical protein SEPCBS119000_002971 [Sporothrix epigloea]|uniref:Zn(2)-C6 fungal-type domain-containing protein n=1 Tax=Sporothrix epigloea TaxID=1892477 RepID=A0ABP0DJ22_9PEZI